MRRPALVRLTGVAVCAMLAFALPVLAGTDTSRTDAGWNTPSPQTGPAVPTSPSSCGPPAISGVLGSGSPDWPFATGTANARLTRNLIGATCAVPKTFPGVFTSGSFSYDAYTFTNEATSMACVTVTLSVTSDCDLMAVAYNGAFDPNDIAANWLSDPGLSSGIPPSDTSFSFYIAAGQTIVIEVLDTDGFTADCAYTLHVAGIDVCQAGQVEAPVYVDEHFIDGSNSNLNGVLEAGESVEFAPAWSNPNAFAVQLDNTLVGFTGPAGPTYSITDHTASYGVIGPGATSNCYDATGNTYVISMIGARPAMEHVDTTVYEASSVFARPNSPEIASKSWTVHVGESFADVPTSNTYYRFVETIFHNGITGGCALGTYCPGNSVTRAQMAVFLLKAEHGSSYVPPACAGVFSDVTCPSPFADWIEQLAAEGVTAGCGGGNYCPDNPVTRAQMAVFLLKTEHGSAYTPPACSAVFNDVTCPSTYANWIEQLAAENVTGGCGGGNYCPDSPSTRGQMAVFLTKTFDLLLYGP